MLGQGLEQGRCAPDPVTQRGAVQINPFAGVDLGLPLKRQVIAIFADQHVRHEARTRAPAFDQARRQRCLCEGFTTSAGHAGADELTHHEVTGDVIQLLGDILAHLTQRAAASSACVTGRQDLIFPSQMLGNRLAAVLALVGWGLVITERLPRQPIGVERAIGISKAFDVPLEIILAKAGVTVPVKIIPIVGIADHGLNITRRSPNPSVPPMASFPDLPLNTVSVICTDLESTMSGWTFCYVPASDVLASAIGRLSVVTLIDGSSASDKHYLSEVNFGSTIAAIRFIIIRYGYKLRCIYPLVR